MSRQRLKPYAFLAHHVMAPALDAVRGTRTMQCNRALEESQWWPLDRIEELQRERLRQLITYSYERVPYYRGLMNEQGTSPFDVKSAADLHKLPVLTRDIVRAHSSELLADGFPRSQLHRSKTGGSTGTPLVFFSTLDDQSNHGYARGIRALRWAGMEMGDRRMLIRMRRESLSQRRSSLHRISRVLERVRELDSRDITTESLPGIVAFLSRPDVQYLGGYPSAVSFIAAWITETGTTPPSLAAIITGGEQLFEHQRQRIRDVFNLETFSKYACNEAFDIAMECEAHSGMHVAAEDIIIEVVDEDGQPVPEGTEGRILMTNLHNYGMPLIRYELGDTGSFVPGTCPCGRQLPRLAHVLGRRFDIVYTPSGRRITGANLGTALLANMPVRQFQFVQEELDLMVVRIVPTADASGAELESMRNRIPLMYQELLGKDVRVELQLTDHIELTSGGKHLLVVSRVDPDSWLNRGPTADAR